MRPVDKWLDSGVHWNVKAKAGRAFIGIIECHCAQPQKDEKGACHRTNLSCSCTYPWYPSIRGEIVAVEKHEGVQSSQ